MNDKADAEFDQFIDRAVEIARDIYERYAPSDSVALRAAVVTVLRFCAQKHPAIMGYNQSPKKKGETDG